jgi:hypothetical protein
VTITGPELDLLQEVLAEDPTADVFLDVAQALFDGGEPRRAAEVLRRALEAGAQSDEAVGLLARSASASGDDAGVRAAAERLGPAAMKADPALARAWALALDRNGQLDEAAAVASDLIAKHGDDPELAAIVERQHAAPPDNRSRGRDPYYTVSRAEAYLESGRPDLAVRVYRRILAANPNDQAIHARLLRLRGMPRESRPWVDDLSEEYWLNRPAPPLNMPLPALVPQVHVAIEALEPEDEATIPGAPMRVNSAQPSSRVRPGLPGMGAGRAVVLDDDDEEATVVAPWVDTTDQPDDPPTQRAEYSGHGHELTELGGFDEVPDLESFGSLSSIADDDEDATEVRTLSEIRALSEHQARSRARSAPLAPAGASRPMGATPRPPPYVSGSFSDSDEDATEIVHQDELEEVTDVRRTLPGADELRQALADADFEEEEPSLEESDDTDTDSIIEQARAIERAAARRRTLFRK